MAESGVTTDRQGPIDRYLREFRSELGRRDGIEDILAEVEDHLREVAAWHAARGMEQETAERHALGRFGRTTTVARAFEDAREGAAVPTLFTRSAGVVAIVGAVAITASFALQLVSQAWERGLFADVAGVGALLLVVSLVGMHVRQRAAYGRLGSVGFGLMVGGGLITAASIPFWFAPGGLVGVLAVAGGAFLFLAATWRTAILPRPALALVLTGVASLVLASTLHQPDGVTRVAPRDYALTAALFLGCAGWAWMGLRMWREPLQVTSRLPGTVA